MYREYRFRKLLPGTSHDDYENEPGANVDYILAFENIDAEVDETLSKRRG